MADTSRAAIFNSKYGYGGYGTILPPPVLLTNTFWDDQKVSETINSRYIHQAMTDSLHRKKLDRPLAFGEGLTECTYCEWIIAHTKRFFLILCELGSPEKIFDIIDASWGDEDLPLSQASIERLGMGSSLERKFSKKQYCFLVRELEEGHHMEYLDEELIPLEVINRWPSGRSTSAIEKVYFPRKRDVYYSRKRVALDEESVRKESFMADVETMKAIRHEHIVSVFASYTHQREGFILLSPPIELTLKSFLQYPPSTFKSFTKDRRRQIVFNWLHCLADALAYLSERGISHRNIKPSSIIVDQKSYHILFVDIGNSKTFESPGISANTFTASDVEGYEYGAPELWVRSTACIDGSSLHRNTLFSGRRYHRRSAFYSTLSDESGSMTDSRASHHPSTTITVRHWKRHPSTSSKSSIFSLSCIFLDLLSFIYKHKPHDFHAHRSAKLRRSRESAPPDSSFHANLPQVHSWMTILETRATKKTDFAFVQSLDLCRDMLSYDPDARPNARLVENTVYQIVSSVVKPEMPHCGVHTIDDIPSPGLKMLGGWDEATRPISMSGGRHSVCTKTSKRSTDTTITSSSSGM